MGWRMKEVNRWRFWTPDLLHVFQKHSGNLLGCTKLPQLFSGFWTAKHRVLGRVMPGHKHLKHIEIYNIIYTTWFSKENTYHNFQTTFTSGVNKMRKVNVLDECATFPDANQVATNRFTAKPAWNRGKLREHYIWEETQFDSTAAAISQPELPHIDKETSSMARQKQTH